MNNDMNCWDFIATRFEFSFQRVFVFVSLIVCSLIDDDNATNSGTAAGTELGIF